VSSWLALRTNTTKTRRHEETQPGWSQDTDGAFLQPSHPAIGQTDLIPTRSIAANSNLGPFVNRKDSDVLRARTAPNVHFLFDDYAVLKIVRFIDHPAKQTAEQKEKHCAGDTRGQAQKAGSGISSERSNAQQNIGDDEQNQNDPAVLPDRQGVNGTAQEAKNRRLGGFLDPIHNEEIRQIKVLPDLPVVRKPLPSRLPEVNRFAELPLFEAGISKVVVNSPAFDAGVQELSIGPLGRRKITLLIVRASFREESEGIAFEALRLER
jgi:hypothetical protein